MDHLIKLFKNVFAFFIKLKEAREDGEIDRSEKWGLVFHVMTSAWDPVLNFGEIKEALKLVAADPDAREELRVALKEEFDLPDDELEQRIEEGLDLLDKNYTYIRTWL